MIPENHDVMECFEKEVVRELMKEVNPSVSEEDVEFINARVTTPWDAGILYSLMLETGDMKV